MSSIQPTGNQGNEPNPQVKVTQNGSLRGRVVEQNPKTLTTNTIQGIFKKCTGTNLVAQYTAALHVEMGLASGISNQHLPQTGLEFFRDNIHLMNSSTRIETVRQLMQHSHEDLGVEPEELNTTVDLLMQDGGYTSCLDAMVRDASSVSEAIKSKQGIPNKEMTHRFTESLLFKISEKLVCDFFAKVNPLNISFQQSFQELKECAEEIEEQGIENLSDSAKQALAKNTETLEELSKEIQRQEEALFSTSVFAHSVQTTFKTVYTETREHKRRIEEKKSEINRLNIERRKAEARQQSVHQIQSQQKAQQQELQKKIKEIDLELERCKSEVNKLQLELKEKILILEKAMDKNSIQTLKTEIEKLKQSI